MKRALLKALVLGLVLATGAVGCKKTPKGPTPIPGAKSSVDSNAGGFPAIGKGGQLPGETDPGSRGIKSNADGSIPAAGLNEFEGMLMDTNVFKNFTVYFEFDKSAVRTGERSKVEAVATELKANAANKLLIEGHCDERGTEEYNRALGERRAQSLREYLSNLGVGPERVRTISYGEDRPAVDGHNDDAWSKNRRGEFILLKPKP